MARVDFPANLVRLEDALKGTGCFVNRVIVARHEEWSFRSPQNGVTFRVPARASCRSSITAQGQFISRVIPLEVRGGLVPANRGKHKVHLVKGAPEPRECLSRKSLQEVCHVPVDGIKPRGEAEKVCLGSENRDCWVGKRRPLLEIPICLHVVEVAMRVDYVSHAARVDAVPP